MYNTLYVDELLNDCNIVCLQEHHLYPDMHRFIKTLRYDIDGFTRSDERMNINDYPRIRAGGMSILWKNNIGHAITPQYALGNDRVMAVKVEFTSNKPLFVINVYMPSSNHSINALVVTQSLNGCLGGDTITQ